MNPSFFLFLLYCYLDMATASLFFLSFFLHSLVFISLEKYFWSLLSLSIMGLYVRSAIFVIEMAGGILHAVSIVVIWPKVIVPFLAIDYVIHNENLRTCTALMQ